MVQVQSYQTASPSWRDSANSVSDGRAGNSAAVQTLSNPRAAAAQYTVQPVTHKTTDMALAARSLPVALDPTATTAAEEEMRSETGVLPVPPLKSFAKIPTEVMAEIARIRDEAAGAGAQSSPGRLNPTPMPAPEAAIGAGPAEPKTDLTLAADTAPVPVPEAQIDLPEVETATQSWMQDHAAPIRDSGSQGDTSAEPEQNSAR